MSLKSPVRNTVLPLRIQACINGAFAGSTGFSGPQILDFFSRDDINIEAYPQSGAPSRKAMLEDCLARFDRETQLQILADLLNYDGPVKYGMPPETDHVFLQSWLDDQGLTTPLKMRDLTPMRTAKLGIGSKGNSQADAVTWDVFLSHASEDKEDFARPLALALSERGLRVWFDEFTLRVGDSLRRSIDKGLSRARFGVVVISPAFLRKEWPQKELDALVAREVDGQKVILPVWHKVDQLIVRRESPILADRLATSSDRGVLKVTMDLLEAMNSPLGASPRSPTVVSLASPVSLNQAIVLDCLRGKPDIRWDTALIISSLHENRPNTAPPASDIRHMITSLAEAGYLVVDHSGTIAVTPKAIEYYRAHRRKD